MNKLVSGAVGVEVALVPNQQRVYFPDVINLRRKRIKHIDFCSFSNLLKTPSGKDIIASVNDKLMFVTLTESNTQLELIQSLPITQLTNNGNRLYINKIIDLPRSYIDISKVPEAALTGKSVYMVFWFDEPAVWGQIIEELRTEIQAFELTITSQKTYFSENKDLLNRRFQNILLSFPTYTHTGKSGINDSYIKNKFLTLTKNNLEFFQKVPLYLFNQNELAYKLRLQNIQFDFQTSYIETLTVTADDLKTVFFNGIIDGGLIFKK